MKDIKGRDLKVGNYVLIVNPPDYPRVLSGDLGKLVGNYWFSKDGTVNVDVYSMDGEPHNVNLNFEPDDLRRINEGILITGRLPSSLNPNRILIQYKAIKNYRA